MKRLSSSWLAAGALGSVLLLAGCSSSDSGTEEQTTSQSVSLSGVVQVGANNSFAKSGQRMPLFAPDVSGQDIQGRPMANVLVLVTDAQGNTFSTTADSSGDFDVELDSGKSYALIFIDPGSLKVLGSLVQAANTANPGAVELNADTNLGNVVIDAATGRAVAQADAKPDAVTQPSGATIRVVDANSMDKDGDGKISQDDVNTLQAEAVETAVASGGDASSAITSLSPLNFMGDANTWVVQERTDSGSHTFTEWDPNANGGMGGEVQAIWDGTRTEGSFRLSRTKKVDGPYGAQVDAIKHAEVTYFNSEVATIYDATDGTTVLRSENRSGYYDKAQADANLAGTMRDCPNNGPTGSTWCEPYSNTSSLSELDPTATFDWKMGLWAWSRFQYADQTGGKIIEGNRDYDTNGMNWEDQGGIPLKIKLGEQVSETRTETFECGPGVTCTGTGSQVFTVNLTDGIITDTLGRKLPIIKVDAQGTFTMDPGTPNDTSDDQSETFDESFYIVAKYGAEAPAKDASGNPVSWQDAFKDVRFGIISKAVDDTVAADTAAFCGANTTDAAAVNVATNKNFIICKTNPDTLGTNSLATAMPDGDAVADATVRNTWLAFLANNIDQIDQFNYEQFQDGGDTYNPGAFFWLERNEDGQGLTPKSWDPSTYLNNPLAENTLQTFTTTLTPDTGTTPNVHYMGTGVSFYYELRVWDPNAENPWDPSVMGAEVKVADNASSAQSAANADMNENVVSVSGQLTIPALDAVNGDGTPVYKDTWAEWYETGATDANGYPIYEPYCASGASLWLVMKADTTDDMGNAVNAVIREEPVEWYSVKGATAVTDPDTCYAGTSANTTP